MKKAAVHPTTKSPSGRHSFSAGDIALQFLDTTWRIGVPVVGAALIGIFVDRRTGSQPLFTLLGVVVGFVVAALLVKRLLDSVLDEEDS